MSPWTVKIVSKTLGWSRSDSTPDDRLSGGRPAVDGGESCRSVQHVFWQDQTKVNVSGLRVPGAKWARADDARVGGVVITAAKAFQR